MKKIVISLLALVVFSCSKAQNTEFSKIALNESLMATSGQQIAFKKILEQYKGKTVLIEVWASWCSDCVKNMPKLKMLQVNNPNVVYLFLSADKTVDKWKEGIEKHDLKGEHYMMNDLMKGKFGTAIDLDWIPRYIILDKKGKIIMYRAIETDFEKVNEALKSIQ